jgi:hypothetical protein
MLFCHLYEMYFSIIYSIDSQRRVRVPLGVREEATGGTRRAHRGTQNSKNLTQMKLIWVEFFIWGYREGDGGTQRGTILIWGYASTKRLRTPDLYEMVFSSSVVVHRDRRKLHRQRGRQASRLRRHSPGNNYREKKLKQFY